MSALDLAYNSAIHTSMKCSLAREFLGRELIVPHFANLPSFQKQQRIDPYSLEEQVDQVYVKMREQDEVRIRRQFLYYSNKCEDIQLGVWVYAADLPAISNSRKLQIK